MTIDVNAGDPPSVWIQWKGTQVCMDFHCGCGAEGHFDGWHAYSARCGSCGQTWLLPRTLALVKIEDALPADREYHGDGVTVMMDLDQAQPGGAL